MLTSAVFCAQIDLSENKLCGIDEYGRGTYTAEGITAIADAMGVSHSLTQVQLDTALDPAACSAPRFTLALTCAYVRSTG